MRFDRHSFEQKLQRAHTRALNVANNSEPPVTEALIAVISYVDAVGEALGAHLDHIEREIERIDRSR